MTIKIDNSFIKFSEEMGEIVIDKLFVSPDQRGEKLGYELLNRVREYAIEKGLNMSLCAQSDEDELSEDDLIRYYEKYGFESDGDCSELMTYYI